MKQQKLLEVVDVPLLTRLCAIPGCKCLGDLILCNSKTKETRETYNESLGEELTTAGTPAHVPIVHAQHHPNVQLFLKPVFSVSVRWI